MPALGVYVHSRSQEEQVGACGVGHVACDVCAFCCGHDLALLRAHVTTARDDPHLLDCALAATTAGAVLCG